MRDLFVTFWFVSALPFALRHPYAGVLLWTWVSIMNPHKLAFGFAHDAPFALVAVAVTFVSLFITKDKLKFTLTPPVVLLILFVGWMCLTTAFAIHPAASASQLNKVLKIQLMTLVAIAAIQSRKHIELFVWVNALSLAFYGVKGGLFTITTGGGGRVGGPAGGFIEENNALGLALVIAIPLLNYLRMTSTRIWMRQGLLAVMLLTTVSVLGSQSRGALLAVAAMGVVLWFRSSHKVVAGVVIVLLGVALVSFMPDSWSNRMATIQTYGEDSSAMGRINAWMMCFNLANDRFLGGGYDIYTLDLFGRYAPDPLDLHVAHSIYFSVLGEHGWIGLFLFLVMWTLVFRTAGKVRKAARQLPDAQWAFYLAGMCQVSLAGYAVGGAFLSLAYFDLPYNILVILVALQRWIAAKQWETDKEGAFGSGGPIDGKTLKKKQLGQT